MRFRSAPRNHKSQGTLYKTALCTTKTQSRLCLTPLAQVSISGLRATAASRSTRTARVVVARWNSYCRRQSSGLQVGGSSSP